MEPGLAAWLAEIRRQNLLTTNGQFSGPFLKRSLGIFMVAKFITES